MGTYKYNNKKFLLIDIPGTYSIMSNSEEEEIARNFICLNKPNVTIVVLDATCLERNLNLLYQIMEITPNVIACVNLLDEAEKKGIQIDLNLLAVKLGIPVVGVIAHQTKTLENLMKTIYNVCNNYTLCSPILVEYSSKIEEYISSISLRIKDSILPINNYLTRWISLKLIDGDSKILDLIKTNFFTDNNTFYDITNNYICNIPTNLKDSIISSILYKSEVIKQSVCIYTNPSYNKKNKKLDRLLTSKYLGIPIMLAFLGLIFWLTIVGANYPSKLLSTFFNFLGEKLTLFLNTINTPNWISSILIDGIYTTLTWIISVMLPPMAIFFPLFTLLEDFGFLPRIAFNLDKYFKKACSSGKQALTMCMGFGCNAAGVVGCRIIDSPREKLISILTNSFVPCNGRFPFLITIALIFFGNYFSGFSSSFIATRNSTFNSFIRYFHDINHIQNIIKYNSKRYTIIFYIRAPFI